MILSLFVILLILPTLASSQDHVICSPADTDRDDVVDIVELSSYISKWKSTEVSIGELIIALTEWKDGCTVYPDDTAPPQVIAFDVQPQNIVQGNPVIISFTVTDDIALSHVKLWRTVDSGNSPDQGSWVLLETKNISGQSVISTFNDTPLIGTYWYGIHVVDQEGNCTTEGNRGCYWPYDPNGGANLGPISIFVAAEPIPAVGDFIGGSNYVMIDVGDFMITCSEDDWYSPDENIKPVIMKFDENQELVKTQLQKMYDNDQRRISLMLWHDSLDEGVTEYYHVVSSRNGILSPKHKNNLNGLISEIKSTGFEELIFRFGLQGNAWPATWQEWNEPLYQENFDFISNVRKTVNQAWCGNEDFCSNLLYDLAVELGGVSDDMVLEYTKRIWIDYNDNFGKADTYGFSIIAFKDITSRTERFIDTLDQSGAGRPNVFAFDIYSDQYSNKEYDLLVEIHDVLQSNNADAPIIIQETYYNNPRIRDDYIRAIADTGIQVDSLFQWPVTEKKHIENNKCGYSTDFPSDYSAYLVNRITADDCIVKSDGLCTSKISWLTNAPVTAIVTVSVDDGPESDIGCMKTFTTDVPWIQKDKEYKFRLYKTDSCDTYSTENLLDIKTITGKLATGVISAKPNPCELIGGRCTSQISWYSNAPENAIVTVKTDGAESFFGCGINSQSDATWIEPDIIYTFSLYSSESCDPLSATDLLDRVTVTGSTASGTIAATPNPCQLIDNVCSSEISWQVDIASNAVVTVSENNAAETIFSCSVNYSQEAPWIRAGSSYVFSLYRSDACEISASNVLLDSISVTGE